MDSVDFKKKYEFKEYTRRYNEKTELEPNVYVENLRFKNTVFFFYDSCINRVNKNRLINNLPVYKIYNTEDKSLPSNFFNGVITKNNPYLITDKLIGFFKKDNNLVPSTNESGEKIGIIHTLDFENSHEILWGKSHELHRDLFHIFRIILQEIPQYLPNYSTYIDTILYDYIPYAKYTTLAKIKYNNNISLLLNYGVYDEEVSPIKLALHRERAFRYFYTKIDFKNAFENSFKDFTKNITSFTKIDKKLENNYIIPILIPLLKEYIPDNSSLGLRVKNMLETDMSSVPNLISSSKISNDNLSRMLNKASSRYITELEEIQKLSIDPLFYM